MLSRRVRGAVVTFYRRLWRATCTVFGALGLAVGFGVLPIEAVMTFVVLSVTAGLTVAIERDSGHRGSALHGSGRWIRIAAMAYGTWIAVLGLGQLLGVGFFLVALGLTASSPPAVRAYLRRWRSSTDDEYEYTAASTTQLCRAWQASYAGLQSAESHSVRLRIIDARQRCLDELERRDPVGFSAWLASAASPAGSPERFIAPRQSGGWGGDLTA
jgi:hypothetical protein